MPVTIGSQLGSYEIIALLGKGGFGEVYRAKDRKLKREVAIKILPDEFSSNHDRLTRFQREAEVLASLNHPNIAAIYDLAAQDQSQFLVLELVDGETLADRIARGPIPVEETLNIAKQIAEALEAAHEKGIIHRDLKPANIKLTPDGKVKVLDFGLAKMREPSVPSNFSNSPTLLTAATSGMILGTAAYMSPEQAKGKAADRSSDVWAFGCVFYEMLTGHQVFEGETVGEILAGIFKTEPDWNRLSADIPHGLRKLLKRCLEKDLKNRFKDMGDVRIEIEDVYRDPVKPGASISRAKRDVFLWTAIVLFAVGFAVVTWLYESQKLRDVPEVRVDITTPFSTDDISLAISPDGKKIVFVATPEGRPQLWLRSLELDSAQPLTGTDGAANPFWAPDSRSVGFFADTKLKKIDVVSGAVQTLANAPAGRGGSWSRNGVIIFAPSVGSLFRIPDTGGEPKVTTTIQRPQQLNHRFPQFLPDGSHFLFYLRGTPEVQGVYVASLDGFLSQRIVEADAAAAYGFGNLFFVRQGKLFAQSFDAASFKLAGNPIAVGDHIPMDRTLYVAAFSVSAEGSVIYRAGSANSQRQLLWFDRSGKEVGHVGDPDADGPANPDISPDGRTVALSRVVNGTLDIWLIDAARNVQKRFTTSVGNIADFPLWSPDGSTIFMQLSGKSGALDLYKKAASGSGTEEPLLPTQENKGPSYKSPSDVSPDGRFLLYRSVDTGYDIWALPLKESEKPFPVVQTNYEERDAQFSPDGKWIAYQSNESERFEIYVRPFPGPGEETRISTKGGAQPRWSHDGKELFYVALNGELMATPIHLTTDSVVAGEPIPLFRTRIAAVQGVFRQQYLVSPDGKRFLFNSPTQDAVMSPLSLILNWKPKDSK